MTDQEEQQQPVILSRFHLVFVDRPKDPYYHTRWDLAKPAEVLAETVEGAGEQLLAMLGEPPRHREWLIRLKKITQEVVTETGVDHAEN